MLYMNLRPESDVSNWPPRDDLVYDMLVPPITKGEWRSVISLSISDHYTIRCHMFFTAVFRTLTSDLDTLSKECNRNAMEIIRSWNAQMDTSDTHNKRKSFFSRVQAQFTSVGSVSWKGCS